MQACRAPLLTAASAAVTAPSPVAAADSSAAAAAAAAFGVSCSALYSHQLLDLSYSCLEQHTLPQEMQ
jgi:hypothetical protein